MKKYFLAITLISVSFSQLGMAGLSPVPANATEKNSKLNALAACVMLQVTTSAAQTDEVEWKVDTATLHYSESEGQVSVFESGLDAVIVQVSYSFIW